VAVVEGSPARLQHAKALAALGAAYRRGGRLDDARQALERGLELAQICDARRVGAEIRAEMREAGFEPSVEPVSGVAALAGSERRMVELAAEGRSEREIAQALFVTPKTVEDRLAGAFRKLGVESREELPRVLAEAA
jgi:DNA-binding NarL/FixJ family response regulator